MTELVNRELKYFAWYFAISLIATLWAFDAMAIHQGSGNSQGDRADGNVANMLYNSWVGFWRPWLVVYAVLTAARVVYFLVRGRSPSNSTAPVE